MFLYVLILFALFVRYVEKKTNGISEEIKWTLEKLTYFCTSAEKVTLLCQIWEHFVDMVNFCFNTVMDLLLKVG